MYVWCGCRRSDGRFMSCIILSAPSMCRRAIRYHPIAVSIFWPTNTCPSTGTITIGGSCSGLRVLAGASLYSSSSISFTSCSVSSSMNGRTLSISSIYIFADRSIRSRVGAGMRWSLNFLSRCRAAPSIARAGADAHPCISRCDSTIHPPICRYRGRVGTIRSMKSNGTAMYASSPRLYGFRA